MSYENIEPKQQDIVDLITESAQKIEIITHPNGTQTKVLTNDPETVYWKTQIVNSPTFARFVYELKNFERLANQAMNHMSKERGMILHEQIKEIVSAFKYSVDAKSSESMDGKMITQNTLIDKLNRVRIEKSLNIKENVKNSLFSSLMGKKESSDSV